jgi:prevent-host-death family protein
MIFNMEEASIETARKALGEIIDKARLAGANTVLTRQGKPAAVVVPLEWFERVSEMDRWPLDMAQIKCPRCDCDSYPDNMGQALTWALGHDCERALREAEE